MSHHSLRIRRPPFYVAALTTGVGPRLLLGLVVDCVLAGETFAPSQHGIGAMMHKDRRTILRWVGALKAKGFIRVVRRGKKLTNVYFLARWLWKRVTGREGRRFDGELQTTLRRLGLKMGFGSPMMAGRPARSTA